jgi:pyridoxine 5-phosphate synthase
MKLGVNVDHVATLRNARLPAGGRAENSVYPDPVEAALICQRAGAHSIVMHLREDRRHIRDRDLFRAKKALRIRLNMEMSIAPGIVTVAKRLRPHQATLVPEKRMERTTEGGLDLFKQTSRVRRVVGCLKERGIEVSLFIDPDRRQLDLAKKVGADAVEFHTGDYANALGASRRRQWQRLKRAAHHASRIPLTAHAGHGLDYENVRALKKIPGLDELNIGYAIITRSLWTGLDRAVRDMRELIL